MTNTISGCVSFWVDSAVGAYGWGAAALGLAEVAAAIGWFVLWLRSRKRPEGQVAQQKALEDAVRKVAKVVCLAVLALGFLWFPYVKYNNAVTKLSEPDPQLASVWGQLSVKSNEVFRLTNLVNGLTEQLSALQSFQTQQVSTLHFHSPEQVQALGDELDKAWVGIDYTDDRKLSRLRRRQQLLVNVAAQAAQELSNRMDQVSTAYPYWNLVRGKYLESLDMIAMEVSNRVSCAEPPSMDDIVSKGQVTQNIMIGDQPYGRFEWNPPCLVIRSKGEVSWMTVHWLGDAINVAYDSKVEPQMNHQMTIPLVQSSNIVNAIKDAIDDMMNDQTPPVAASAN